MFDGIGISAPLKMCLQKITSETNKSTRSDTYSVFEIKSYKINFYLRRKSYSYMADW
jgi:hypothetical protein